MSSSSDDITAGAYRRQEPSRPCLFLRNRIAWRVLLCDFASFAFMMKFRGLSLLICLWTIWTLSGHLTTYLMAIFGHGPERSPLIAVSETGEEFPVNIIFSVAFSISALVDKSPLLSISKAVIIFLMHRYHQMQAPEHSQCKKAFEIFMLITEWTVCIGGIVAAICQGKLFPCIHQAYVTSAVVLGALLQLRTAIALHHTSRSSRRMSHIRTISAYVTSFNTLILVGSQIITAICEDDQIGQIFRIIFIISDWLVAFGFCLHYMSYYNDFQCLTIRFPGNIKEDWIILIEDLEAGDAKNIQRTSEPDLEKGP